MNIRDELKAGFLIILGLFLFVLSVWVMGSERQIFAEQEEFYVSFSNVGGLKEGAPVRLGGITVGRVSKIGFAKNLRDTSVYLTLLINETYLERIRKGSIVTIETQGLLGDKIVSIAPGPNHEPAMPGAELASRDPADMAQVLQKAGVVVDNTVTISKEVSELLERFNANTLDSFSRASKSVANVLHELEEGKGLLHRLVYSEEDAQITKDIARAAQNLDEIMHEIRSGEGLLHTLIYDPQGKKTIAALTRASDSFARTSDRINDLASEIAEGQGLLHDLIYSDAPEGLDEIIATLRETAHNLQLASEQLSQGSGTLGALLVDPSLYENLVEVTGDAKRSFLLRHAIRSSLESD